MRRIRAGFGAQRPGCEEYSQWRDPKRPGEEKLEERKEEGGERERERESEANLELSGG